MIEKSTIQRIKDVARVADVVADFCHLKRSGTELTCPCPLHGGRKLDHFKVSPKKNIFHCFVCGAHGNAIDFLMQYSNLTYPDAIRWLGQKYGIFVDEEKRFTNVRPSKAVPIEKLPELPMLDLPAWMVKQKMTGLETDLLCRWLHSLPWNKEQRNRLDRVLRAYGVGHSQNGMTIFWQIDEEGRVRTGKMMRYKADGHRDKESRYAMDWIHKSLERARMTQYYDSERMEVHTCFFGLHLLHAKGVGNYTINIVESEKTALIMATAMGAANGLWMATGGMQFLKKEGIENLLRYGLPIVLHPDHDGASTWQKKMDEFGFKPGRDYQISNQYVQAYWRETDGPKADAADIIVRMMTEAARDNEMRPMRELIERWKANYPAFATLNDRLGLEPIKVIVPPNPKDDERAE